MKKHIFEIYTKDPETGESGYEIEWVECTKKDLKKFPNFDCIISTDDCPFQVYPSVIKWNGTDVVEVW